MRALRIALPKGRLLSHGLGLFAAAGVPVPDAAELKSRRLIFLKQDVEWILVKDGDVPVYVEHGAADIGIAGLDQILEHDADVYQPLRLPFGSCRMMLIAAHGAPPLTPASTGAIATKYPRITERYLLRRGIHLEIVPLQGSVELSAVLGLTSHIVDLVETGETIRIHSLTPVETVAEIAPYLVINRNAYRIDNGRIRRVVQTVERALTTGAVT